MPYSWLTRLNDVTPSGPGRPKRDRARQRKNRRRARASRR